MPCILVESTLISYNIEYKERFVCKEGCSTFIQKYKYAAIRYEGLIRIVPDMKHAKIHEKLNYTNSVCNG